MCSLVPSLKPSRPGLLWARHHCGPRTRNQAQAACPLELPCGDTRRSSLERAGVASRTQKEARVSSRTPPCGCARSSHQLARQGHGGPEDADSGAGSSPSLGSL